MLPGSAGWLSAKGESVTEAIFSTRCLVEFSTKEIKMKCLTVCQVAVLALFMGCSDTAEPEGPGEIESLGASVSLGIANTVCPLMGGDVDETVTTSWDGKTIGFCCAKCIPAWDKLSDEEKTEKLAKAASGDADGGHKHGGHSHGDGDHEHGDHKHGADKDGADKDGAEKPAKSGK